MPEARACPILPVTDLDRALAHYAALGCSVSRHDDTYGFAALAGVELHLSVVADHDPLRTASAVFLHVPDADDLARRWAGVPRTGEPVDTDVRHARGLAHRPGRQPAPLRVTATVPGVSTQTRWGIVGPGRIAESVVQDFPHVPGAQVTAVGSRSLDRAQAFADRHGIGTAHGSYEALIADPDVDVLYLATPHPQHHAVALQAIAAGKALLVEKSFTATVAGAQEVVDAARAAGVFVMEAMWTRFQPAVVAMNALIADGAIGQVRSVQADLGVAREFDPADRLFAKELGGGALLDLGVYVVSFAQMLLGAPDSVRAVGSTFPTGVDAEAALLLGWDDGRSATLTTSLRNSLPGQARVFGTTGWIDVLPRFHHPATIVLHREDTDPEEIVLPASGTGYSHEIAEVHEGVLAGRTESTVMPLADTLAVLRVLEEAADQLGVRFAEA